MIRSTLETDADPERARRAEIDRAAIVAGDDCFIEQVLGAADEREAAGDGHARDRIDRQRGGQHNGRSEEHTSELQSLMRISYDVFCLKKKKPKSKISRKYDKYVTTI